MEQDLTLQIINYKKTVGIIRWKLITKFAILRSKAYSYLIGDGDESKVAKATKKFILKRKLKFEDHNHCLEPTQLENKIYQLQKSKLYVDIIKNIVISEKHNVFSEEVYKIACYKRKHKQT